MRHLTLEASNNLYCFNPGDVVYYANEFGEEMYIINKGFCEVRHKFTSSYYVVTMTIKSG